ncbi:hypothetical protein NEUTE1DRAFT_55372, partial [Neurospora tetrasperma FGSC 2508]
NKFTIYYLNNIFIYFETLIEYKEYVRKILDVLYEYEFSINIEKSEFYIREIIFFRYLILKNKVRIELSKVEAI